MAKRLPNFHGPDSNVSVSQSDPLDPVQGSTSETLKCQNQTALTPDGSESVSVDSQENGSIESESLECAICLQTCIHPVRLPCSHIFCFLCVKGVAIQSKRCALCRQDIPLDFFNNPLLLRKEDLLKESSFEGGFQWFYQGRNGWWQYDERASQDIEEQYKNGDTEIEILIAGFLYVIDYKNMVQYRRNDPLRRRHIKRAIISQIEKKGVAGLVVTSHLSGLGSPHRLEGDGGENVPCVVQNNALSPQHPGTTAQQRGHSTTTPAQSRSRSLGRLPAVPHNTPEGQTTADCPANHGTQAQNQPQGTTRRDDDVTERLASLSLDSVPAPPHSIGYNTGVPPGVSSLPTSTRPQRTLPTAPSNQRNRQQAHTSDRTTQQQ